MNPAFDPLPLGDVQGIVLRGYNFPAVRHFVLRVRSAPAARGLVGRLAAGPDPQVSSAADWGATPPEYRLQLGFTYRGLEALGLPDASLAGFRRDGHRAFAAGAVARAAAVGDTGPDDPANWIGQLNNADAVHALASLYVADEAQVEAWSVRLRDLWGDAVEELSAHTGAVLPDHTIHLGYRDGISQPNVGGAPPPASPSPFVSDPGLFLLGRPVPSPELTMPVPDPPEFGRDGSFAAFRILEQDAAGFEKFLTDTATATGQTREWVAAKVCGRWRTGVPLALSPDTPNPVPPIPDADLDRYDYDNDPGGRRTPPGSHMRRTFPRGDDITGGVGAALRHRLIRRGMPYGPAFDPAHPDAGPRGLLGLFIGASIDQQFEFITREWVNKGGFNGLLAVDNPDPLTRGPAPATGAMVIPVADPPPVRLTGFGPFVTTRGGAYLFLPSRPALRHVAALA